MSGVVHNNSNPIQRSRTSGAFLHPKSGRPIASKNVVQRVIPTQANTYRHTNNVVETANPTQAKTYRHNPYKK